MKKIFLLISFVSSTFLAQDSIPIQPEETPYLLDKGKFQIENGLTYRKIDNKNKIFVLPTVLTKFGLTNKFELRLTTEMQLFEENKTNKYFLAPLVFGFKTKLFKEKGILPETAVILQSTIPFLASKSAQNNIWSPEIIVMSQGNYSNFFGMNYNFGIKWDEINSHPFYFQKQTATLNFSEKFCTYHEFFSTFHTHFRGQTNINNGFMYLFTNDLVIDVSGGFGVTSEAPIWFTSVTFSARF